MEPDYIFILGRHWANMRPPGKSIWMSLFFAACQRDGARLPTVEVDVSCWHMFVCIVHGGFVRRHVTSHHSISRLSGSP